MAQVACFATTGLADMTIATPIPFRAASAYGIAPGRGVTAVAPVASAGGSPGSGESPTSRLVGGSVPGPARLDEPGGVRQVGPALQLYTRAADRIEAATALQVGRSVDLTG